MALVITLGTVRIPVCRESTSKAFPRRYLRRYLQAPATLSLSEHEGKHLLNGAQPIDTRTPRLENFLIARAAPDRGCVLRSRPTAESRVISAHLQHRLLASLLLLLPKWKLYQRRWVEGRSPPCGRGLCVARCED